MTHLDLLALGQMGVTPWHFNPAWFVLLAVVVPALTWLGFAWKRALDEDPHRLRRSGLRELRRLLVRIRRSGSVPQPVHLHGWCHAAARTWDIRVSAPTGVQLSQSLQTLTQDPLSASAWRELWSMTERGLYGAEAAPPADWLERASKAAGTVQVPRRERWLPDRVAHWLPSKAATGWLLVCTATCFIAGGARADQDQTTPAVHRDTQKSAVTALRAHWNDWTAHYNIAAAQIQAGNWNVAVAHAADAFLLHPSSGNNRDNLRFALQQAGTMDPTLRRLLYGAWFQRLPVLLSPVGWQRLALISSLVLAAGLTALVIALYVPKHRRPLGLGGAGGAAVGVSLLGLAIMAFTSYGALSQPSAGMLLEGVNLNPSPTELVPEQETSPATAGSVVLAGHSFLGWQQISNGANISGWVRNSAVLPFYE